MENSRDQGRPGGRKSAGGKARRQSERLIMNAAERIFAVRGFSGATMEQIAAAAGVPKANIHYYFGTKKNLYQRLIRDICEEWLAAAQSFDDDVPLRALRGYIEAKRDQPCEPPYGFRLWANEILAGAPFAAGYISAELHEWLLSRERIIGRWIVEGRIRPVEPRTLIYMIWASTQHYADFASQITLLNNGKALDKESFLAAKRSIADIVLNGLAPPSAKNRP